MTLSQFGFRQYLPDLRLVHLLDRAAPAVALNWLEAALRRVLAVLLQILLVVVLRLPVRRVLCGVQLRYDCAAERGHGRLESGLRRLERGALRVRRVPDVRAVLRAAIATLPVERRRVVNLPEQIDQRAGSNIACTASDKDAQLRNPIELKLEK